MAIDTIVLSVICLFSLAAQSNADFQNFTQKDGLSSDYVLSFHQDHLGFMWIGTESGLNRFDGQNFLHFKHDPEDEATIDDNWVVSIYEDHEHNLWIGTEIGINFLDRQSGKIERIPILDEGEVIQVVISEFFEDEKGNLWINSEGKGLFQLKKSSTEKSDWYAESYTIASEINRQRPCKMVFANEKDLWLTDGNMLINYQIDTKEERLFHPQSSYATQEVPLDIIKSTYLEDGRIMLFAGQQFFVLDTKAKNPQLKALGPPIQSLQKNEFSSANFLSFLVEDEEMLFISFNRSLYFFNTNTNELDPIQFQNQNFDQLLPNFIRSIFKDQQGNYWIGTSGSGIYLYRSIATPFSFYQNDPSNPNSISSGQVRTFAEDHQGNIWVGILNHGIDQFSFTKQQNLQKEKSLIPLAGQSNTLASNRIVKIIQGPEQNLWVASLTQGVLKLNSSGSPLKSFKYREGDPSSISANRIWALAKDPQGYIWAGSWDNGLNRIDPRTESIEKYLHNPNNPNSLINDEIRCLFVDQQGFIWIGTNNGVSKYDPKNQEFTNYFHDPKDPSSLSDKLVWAIYVDQEGVLWVGTDTGLNRYNEAQAGFERFYEKDGLPDNTIFGILEDDEGTLWVSTENGLARKISSGGDKAFFPLGSAEGLQTTSFIPKAYLNSTQSAQLFFGSTDGILALDPSLLKSDLPRPQLALHSLSTLKASQGGAEPNTNYFIGREEKPVELGYQDQFLTITLADLNWKDRRGLRYDYQLLGLSPQWMEVKEDMQINLNNLSSGRYRLNVRVRNLENISSEAEELLQIRVYPPWWKSNWAYLFYVLAIVLGIYGLYRFQLRRQLEKQEAQNLRALDGFKNKLYANITHEFRTPLTIISGMLDQIEKNPKKWLAKGTKMIRSNNQNLLDLINQMLELQKVESGKLELQMQQGDILPFLHSLFDQFQAFAQSKEQQMEFRSDLDSLQMDFDPEKTLRIVSNLLSNAIKYTPEKGQIVFKLSREKEAKQSAQDYLKISVEDSGPGIPADQLPFIFDRFYQANVRATGSGSGTGIGLSLTKELVELLDGTIDVKSTDGQGATFQVFLPISQKAQILQPADLPSLPSAIFGLEGPLDKESKPSAKRPIALVVEDNKDIASYLQICLEEYYQLEFAFDGQMGIDQALELVPDIIISDVMMPHKDGFELCESLKEDIRTSHIPIILLTAKSDVESRIAGLKHGADDYLAKPFHEEELLVRMQNLLEIRRKLQERYQNIYDAPLPKVKVAEPNVEDAFILKVKALFEAQMIDPDFNLDQLSKALNLSRSNLYRKIKALTGRSPAIYLRSLRLQKARQILRSTNASIKQVAYEVGFSDPSYFSRSYAEEFGERPSNTVK